MNMENITKTYTKREISEYVLSTAGKSMNEAAIYKRINKFINNGTLYRASKGLYRFTNKSRYDYSLKEPISFDVLDALKESIPDDLGYIVYESTILNEFLNHLLAHSVTIVEVPKDYADYIFWKLQESGIKNIMLNPSDDERYRYNPSVIVKSMVSKAPIRAKEHKITIEKLVVDIVCDTLINQFFEGAEKEDMIKEIFDKYTVKYDSIKNYSKRRNAFDEVLDYIPKEERTYFYD